MFGDARQTDSPQGSGAAAPLIRSLRNIGAGPLLEGVSLVYVALPFFIFALGWLRIWIGVPVAIVTGVAVWRALSGATRVSRPSALAGRREWIVLGGLLAVVLFVVLYSGAGGYAHQYDDYRRHNALVRDLIEMPWPLFYPNSPLGGQPGWLAFYIANGLPASVVGSVFGWNAASHAVFVWTAGGFFLAVCWFLRVIGRISFRYGLFFVFFGGVDIVGRVLLLGWYVDGTQMLSNWAVRYSVGSTPQVAELMQGIFWFYPSNLNFIYYAPQHVLGPWLCLLGPSRTLELREHRRGGCRPVGDGALHRVEQSGVSTRLPVGEAERTEHMAHPAARLRRRVRSLRLALPARGARGIGASASRVVVARPGDAGCGTVVRARDVQRPDDEVRDPRTDRPPGVDRNGDDLGTRRRGAAQGPRPRRGSGDRQHGLGRRPDARSQRWAVGSVSSEPGEADAPTGARRGSVVLRRRRAVLALACTPWGAAPLAFVGGIELPDRRGCVRPDLPSDLLALEKSRERGIR
ncbi:MAG: hypothetical protein JRG82_04075 [Deltaproteobacteria bacterium]|nr:hypothetical protein [Deltaproteobacteria bacterium]